MSQLFVDNIKNRTGGAIGAPSGIVVTGVVTATSLSGNASGLSGIDATALKDSGGNIKIQANTSGIVVTGASTFSSNVSVGGVLTYDDVTNVDSVGLITARSGIRIGAGQSVSAVSGIATYYGDGSQLSGIELGTQNFVASGTIPNGATVVVNTDGTVGIVTATSVGPSVGSEVVFNSGVTQEISAVYDSVNQKVVIAYQDSTNSDYGTAIVGTVSGTSISFGSEVVFNSTLQTSWCSATYIGSSKVVIAFKDVVNPGSGNVTTGQAIVGTVSGNSISFGSAATFNSGITQYISSAYDANSGKVVITYQDANNSFRAVSKVATVSGTSISFGSVAVLSSGTSAAYNSTTYDSTNNKVVVSYNDGDNNNYGISRVGTVSGTSISFGSAVVFNSGSTGVISSTFDSTNGKVVIAYRDDGDGYTGRAIVGTVSGTSISFGSEVQFNSGNTQEISPVYDSSNNKVIIVYRDNGNSNYGTVVEGTVSGTSISFGSEFVFMSDTTHTYFTATTYDSTNEKVVISYRDQGDSNKGTSVIYTPVVSSTNLTTENYIGIAAEAISNTATGKINVLGGVNSGQTGLTTAKTYYVQGNGTLATSAGDPSVVAGTSISNTKILIRQ
jgi:hypothetical protein